MCRSGRIGGTSGSTAVGNIKSRERRGETWLRGEGAAFGDQQAIRGNTEAGMVVEAVPSAPVIIAEAELLLQLLVIALDPLSRVAQKVDGLRL
jgi:hypothetical protein